MLPELRAVRNSLWLSNGRGFQSEKIEQDDSLCEPEVPFMAGSVEDPVRETSHTAHTHCYVQATGSLY